MGNAGERRAVTSAALLAAAILWPGASAMAGGAEADPAPPAPGETRVEFSGFAQLRYTNIDNPKGDPGDPEPQLTRLRQRLTVRHGPY
jgi:hypothetical protein